MKPLSLLPAALLLALIVVPVAISQANPAGPFFMSVPVIYQAKVPEGGSAAPTATATPVPGGPTPTSTPGAQVSWLQRLNDVRAMANLPPVTENADWSAGGVKHSTYMVKNNYIGHDEDPSNQYYTAEGRAAAQNGNVAFGGGNNSEAAWVNVWVTAPFHMIGMIDYKLKQSGFGSYREGNNGAATLDVSRGRNALTPSPSNVLWPADGKTIDLLRYSGGEYPDPLTSCAGYTTPSGIPLYIMTPFADTVTNISLKQGATSLDICTYNGSTYTNPDPAAQDLARNIMNGRNATVIIPKEPLVAGSSYTMSATFTGGTTTWTFTTSALATIQVESAVSQTR